MAGGIFIKQNKIRPGFYHKFIAAPKARRLFADLGVAALPLALDWGAVGEIISIDMDAPESEFLSKFGRARSGLPLIRECLKRAETLLVYRVGGGLKAELDMTPQPVTATAKYPGARGNDIAVQITDDPNNVGAYIVTTYIDSITRDEQDNIVNVEDIQNNDWVEFSGTGAITAAAGGQLTGGDDEAPVVDDYNKFLTALEPQAFNALGLPVNDTALKPMFAEATRKCIEEQGKLVQCFMPDYKAGYEAVTSIRNGVVLEDGTVIDKAAAVAWMTGAAASAGPATSLTYMAYDGAVEPDIALSDQQIKDALTGGHVVFVKQTDDYGNSVGVVEQDINTLIRFTKDRPQPWSKNRVVRALYYLVNSLTRVWHLYYIGKVDNNEIGRALFKADVVTMMKELVERGAFENFDAENDIVISKGEASDAVVAQLAVRPVDAMEKMYFTVEVN